MGAVDLSGLKAFRLKGDRRHGARRITSLSLSSLSDSYSNRPEGKRLSCFKAGVLLIGEIQPTGPIGAKVRFFFSEIELVEGARILLAPHHYGDKILITEMVDLQYFCGDSDHL
jgi:hypothetical protein